MYKDFLSTRIIIWPRFAKALIRTYNPYMRIYAFYTLYIEFAFIAIGRADWGREYIEFIKMATT